MAEHSASVTIQAPVHQVYELFSHFNDFPKFMRFVKEVTYLDDRRSHWVVQVLGRHEWDAVNEDWIPGRQIGWRSTSGLRNRGRVKFRAIGPNRTIVDVYIHYIPPTGTLGALGENFGGGSYFDTLLQNELNEFAQMVKAAPLGALDPMSSHYLFHKESAVTRGTATPRQLASMQLDPMMSREAMSERQARIEQEKASESEAQRLRQEEIKQRTELEQRLRLEQQAILEREAAKRLAEKRTREAEVHLSVPRPLDPVYDTLGGRNASLDRTSLGDKDSFRTRHPNYEQDPMTSRYPWKRSRETVKLPEEDIKVDSPWRISIRGATVPLSLEGTGENPPASP